ncbi:MAG: Vitamin B12-binding protein [Firmicutes bacterium]|nr:Vitamin B12-binding protein [candidate division NPL-UPA2 bacterium]
MRRIAFVSLIVVLAFALSGCAVLNVLQPSIVVTDDLGREIRLERAARRIVSLAPSNTEMLFALGIEDKVVGVTDICDYPAQAATKEKVGSFGTPSVEKIVSLKPDLVLAASLHKTVGEQLTALGIPVIVLNAESIQGVLDNADLLGRVTGATRGTAQLKRQISADLNAVDERVKALTNEQRPLVYYEVWSNPIMTAGPNTFLHELITRAGGINLGATATTNWPTLSLEELLSRQPQVMFYGHATETVEQIKQRPDWGSIPALRDGRVYLVDENLILRPGPRIGQALRLLSAQLHPDLWR